MPICGRYGVNCFFNVATKRLARRQAFYCQFRVGDVFVCSVEVRPAELNMAAEEQAPDWESALPRFVRRIAADLDAAAEECYIVNIAKLEEGKKNSVEASPVLVGPVWRAVARVASKGPILPKKKDFHVCLPDNSPVNMHMSSPGWQPCQDWIPSPT